MDWKLEVVVVPVADMDRAKQFYEQQVGFQLDVDHTAGEDFRVVQLTPPGSACSITLMRNPDRAGALRGLHLTVSDIEAAQRQLSENDVEVEGPFHFDSGEQRSGLHPQHADYGSFLSFGDPDGNTWLVQEVRGKSGS
jgi:catechol 2,3-dioxygenase-like lactoylglutathione lyase family enzyme